jgi:hypothetical protein
MVCLYRLAYHFGKVAGRRTDALKYSAKSADLAIRHAAFGEGIVYIKTAITMSRNVIEYKALLKIIDLAIADMTKAKANKFRLSQSIMAFGAASKSDPEMEAYKGLKDEVEKAITEAKKPQISQPASPAPVSVVQLSVKVSTQMSQILLPISQPPEGALSITQPVASVNLGGTMSIPQAIQERASTNNDDNATIKDDVKKKGRFSKAGSLGGLLGQLSYIGKRYRDEEGKDKDKGGSSCSSSCLIS